MAGQGVAVISPDDPDGYGIPTLQLLDARVDPFEELTTSSPAFSDDTVLAVYNGHASVGVSYNDSRTLVAGQFPGVGERVAAFGWSGSIPYESFAVADDLPEDLKQAITDAFLDIASTEDGFVLLNDLYFIDGLVPVDSSVY